MDTRQEARVRAEERLRHLDLEREIRSLRERLAAVTSRVELLRSDPHPEVRWAAHGLLEAIGEDVQ